MGTGSVLLAGVNLAFVPSLYFGMDPAHFYAANGWGSTASIGLVNMLWIGVLGVSILRARGIETAGTGDAEPAAPATRTGAMRMSDAWEGIVVKKSRGLLDGSNLYRRLTIRHADGTTTKVRVNRDLWDALAEGDMVSKAPGQPPERRST